MQATASVPATVSLPVSASGSRRRSYGRSRSYGRRRSYGRSRSYGRLSRYQARAIARRAYVRAKWPSSQFAHVRVARGSQAAQALGISPGVAFSDASSEEQARRRQMQWYGRGGYVGRTLGAALGGAFGTVAGTGLAAATKGSAAPLVPLLTAAGGKIGGDLGDKAGDWLWDRSE